MLKGISNYVINVEAIPFSTSASVNEKLLSIADTIKSLPQTQVTTPVKDTNAGIQAKQSQTAVQHSALNLSSNTAQKKDTQTKILPNQVSQYTKIDTSSTIVYNEILPFQKPRTTQDELYTSNFLLAIPEKNISKYLITSQRKDTTDSVPHEKLQTIVIVPEKTGFEGKVRNVSIDWVPAFLLLSLFTFAWIKILYQKYIVQVIASLINYQVSVRLLRERNVLFQNMALGLNLVFALNTGLFLYYLTRFFNINWHLNQLQSLIILSLGIVIMYGIKTLICKILGNIFLIKEEFLEYTHNINLYNKNIGLFLFPIVISFPYIPDPIRPTVIYIGIVVVLGMILLRITRGIQIILRKGASTFYLILYLCAIEILPILLLVKFSSTLI